MTNQNGQIILLALEQLNGPATVAEIAAHIADTTGLHSNEVKGPVQETLNGGVRYGYIQKLNRKYYATPVDPGELGKTEYANRENTSGTTDVNGGEETDGRSVDADELEDRGGRRRRSRGGRSRSRSRRGSRRRRRSRR